MKKLVEAEEKPWWALDIKEVAGQSARVLALGAVAAVVLMAAPGSAFAARSGGRMGGGGGGLSGRASGVSFFQMPGW